MDKMFVNNLCIILRISIDHSMEISFAGKQEVATIEDAAKMKLIQVIPVNSFYLGLCHGTSTTDVR